MGPARAAGGILLALRLLVLAIAHDSTSLCALSFCTCDRISGGIRATCICPTDQDLKLSSTTMPPTLRDLNVEGCRSVDAASFSLANLTLRLLRVHNCRSVIFRSLAFNNTGGLNQGLHVEIRHSDIIKLEQHVFGTVLGPVSMTMSDARRAVVQGFAFSWLSALSIQDVSQLELHEHSFKLQTGTLGHHGPSAIIILQNVVVPIIPSYAFSSPAAEIRIQNSTVRTVSTNAFAAITFYSVVFHNTVIELVERMAFSDRTLIFNLFLTELRIRTLMPGALMSAISNLSLEHSSVDEVREGSVNVTVATAAIRNNLFYRVHRRGLELHKWNNLTIYNNTFLRLDARALSYIYQPVRNHQYEFSFSRNVIVNADKGALHFGVLDSIVPFVEDNVFKQLCHCKLKLSIKRLAKGSDMLLATDYGNKVELESAPPLDWWVYLYNTSACVVDQTLAQCFNVQQGYMTFRNFTEYVCEAQDVTCETSEVIYGTSTSDGDWVDPDAGLERSKRILSLIFLFAVSCMAVIFAVSVIMWARKKKAWLRIRTETRRWITCVPLLSTGVSTAGSISRLSVHEYAEILDGRRRNPPEGQTDIEEGGAFGIHNANEEVEVEEVYVEDKATQTLPDELTQEVLQSLRERLDDPTNYSEAKDVIEHLYDLIKVEDKNCSGERNNVQEDDNDDGEDSIDQLYDVIGPSRPLSSCPPTPRIRRLNLTFSDAGTSPVDLLDAPTAITGLESPAQYAKVCKSKSPAVCEYTEPRDRQVNVYTELPGKGSSVSNGESGGGESSGAGSIGSLLSDGLGIFKALENILPRRRRAFAVCEYTEPSDARVHVYTEISNRNGSVANRPLPSRPEEIHGS